MRTGGLKGDTTAVQLLLRCGSEVYAAPELVVSGHGRGVGLGVQRGQRMQESIEDGRCTVRVRFRTQRGDMDVLHCDLVLCFWHAN